MFNLILCGLNLNLRKREEVGCTRIISFQEIRVLNKLNKAMLAAKRSAGVAPEVSVRIPLRTGNNVFKQGIYPGLKPRRDITSPKQGYQWPQLKNIPCVEKFPKILFWRLFEASHFRFSHRPVFPIGATDVKFLLRNENIHRSLVFALWWFWLTQINTKQTKGFIST